MKIINIALILIFLLTACTTQTDLPTNKDKGEVLGIETRNQVIEQTSESKETLVDVEIEEELLQPVEPVVEKLKPSPPPQKTYVAPPVPEPEPVVTQPKSNCHPSYSGCLRADASDYDCIGGSGNGPYYTGRVQVIGPDVFGLDRDHDGIGCE